MAAGKHVRIKYDARDSDGRIVGSVCVRSSDTSCEAKWCPKTVNAGLHQLTVGMAWWYRHYAYEQRPEAQGQYESAESETRSEQVGLGQEPSTVGLEKAPT